MCIYMYTHTYIHIHTPTHWQYIYIRSPPQEMQSSLPWPMYLNIVVCIYTSIYLSIYLSIYIYIFISISISISIYVYLSVHLYVTYLHKKRNRYRSSHLLADAALRPVANTHTHTYIYIYVYLSIYLLSTSNVPLQEMQSSSLWTVDLSIYI